MITMLTLVKLLNIHQVQGRMVNGLVLFGEICRLDQGNLGMEREMRWIGRIGLVCVKKYGY